MSIGNTIYQVVVYVIIAAVVVIGGLTIRFLIKGSNKNSSKKQG